MLQNVEVTALLVTPVHIMNLTSLSCVSPTNKFISSDYVVTDSFGAFRGEKECGVVSSKCLFSQE